MIERMNAMRSTYIAKALALAGIAAAAGGSFAVVNTIAQGSLWESPKAKAEIEKANAEMAKAKAELEMAKAQLLDAINKLKGTENMSAALIAAAVAQAKGVYAMAAATEKAASTNAKGLVESTEVASHVDNTMFDSFTGPLISEPAKQIAALNEKLARLKREAESGIDRKTRRGLSESERADRIAQLAIVEEERAVVQESASKNMSDTLGMLITGAMQGLGGMGSLYPRDSKAVTYSSRRFIEEP